MYRIILLVLGILRIISLVLGILLHTHVYRILSLVLDILLHTHVQLCPIVQPLCCYHLKLVLDCLKVVLYETVNNLF